jgi:hypothetical protein
MIRHVASAALAICLCASGTAFARDSSRYVCSAVAELKGDGATWRIGISIDFFDSRAESGDARKYVLSSIYQGKLFQGSMIDRSDKFGQGSVFLKNGRSLLFAGSFKLEQQKDDSWVMAIDGKLNDDPAAGTKTYPVKAKLPCMDLSA